MICAACQQEVSDSGLGSPLPHRVQGSQEFCLGFIREKLDTSTGGTLLITPAIKEELEELEAEAREAAITEPGRKVRSDAGTKRGPRKKGGLDSVPVPGGPPSQEPERVATKPPTKVEDWMNSKITSAVLDSTTGDAVPKPRSNPPVYLVLPGAPPSYTDYAEACSKAEEQAEQNPGTTPYLVWEARPKDSFEKGVTRTRLGRVRKAKP